MVKEVVQLSKEDKQDLKNQSENLSQYKKNLKLLIDGKEAQMVPKTGRGMKSKNPYKLTSDGMFGNLRIDQEKLNDFKLEASKGDKKVLSRKADRNLIDLLTKRYNSKKQFSPQSPWRS